MPRKKTADPRRLHDDPRRHCVSVRVNETELARLDRERGHYLRGEWLRRTWLKTTPRTIPEINRETRVALARTTANLNQIARVMNAGGRVHDADLVEIIAELRGQVQALRADLVGIVHQVDEDQVED